MNTSQIEIVQESFSKIVPIADQAAEIFYANLFEIAPSIRTMFPADLASQRKKLVAALAMAVSSLKWPQALAPKLKELGFRHSAHYGVLPWHYEIVGEALMKTLATGLGDDWNNRTEEAWAETYQFIRHNMLAGSEELMSVA